MRDNWLADDMLFEEAGEVYGLSINCQTVYIGKVEDVRAAMAAPEEHPEMVLKLEAVGVDASGNEEEKYEADKTRRSGLDGSGPTRTARRKKGDTRRTQTQKGAPGY